MKKIMMRHKNYALLLCLLGSAIRLLYGVFHEPWLQSPDQLAWELVLDQKSFRYDHLIHYPHEGGSILISIISQIFIVVNEVNALSVSAFVLDFIVRYAQIAIVEKIFNQKTAWTFGLWSILATSTTIPWGTTVFGLHYISSIFPFLLLLLIERLNNTSRQFLLLGIFIGMAIWFHYSNLILLPVCFLMLLKNKTHLKSLLIILCGTIAVMILHVLVRSSFSAGFELNPFSFFSIRGEDISLNLATVWKNLKNLPKAITNSFIALPFNGSSRIYYEIAFYIFTGLAVVGVFTLRKNNVVPVYLFPVILIVLLFLLSYIASPFYYAEKTGNHSAFRHMSYVIPLLTLLIIIGLESFNSKIILYIFLVVAASRSMNVFRANKTSNSDQMAIKTGWVLGTKFGHDPKTIENIVNPQLSAKDNIWQGIGWGICSSLLQESAANNKQEVAIKIQKLIALYTLYPDAYKENLRKGFRHSFSAEVSPKLNPQLLGLIENEINVKSSSLRKIQKSK